MEAALRVGRPKVRHRAYAGHQQFGAEVLASHHFDFMEKRPVPDREGLLQHARSALIKRVQSDVGKAGMTPSGVNLEEDPCDLL